MTLDAPWSDGNGDEIERGAADAPPEPLIDPIHWDSAVDTTGMKRANPDTPPVDAQPVEPLNTPPLTPTELANYPIRVVVDQHGHYWRDYGDHWSMCPVSDENKATDPVYEFYPLDAARAGDGLLREAAQAVVEAIEAWQGDSPRHPEQDWAERLRAALHATAAEPRA